MLHPFPDPPPGGDTPAAPVADPTSGPVITVQPPIIPTPITVPVPIPEPVVAQPAPATPTPAPTTPATEPPKVVQDPPKPDPVTTLSAEDREKIEKQAHYMLRNEHELDYFVSVIEKNSGDDRINKNTSRISGLESELAKSRAIIKYGLTEHDMQFVSGNEPETIMKNAEAFKAYKDSLVAAAPVPNGQPTIEPAPVATPPPALPVYTEGAMPATVAQAEAELIESFNAERTAIEQRLGIS